MITDKMRLHLSYGQEVSLVKALDLNEVTRIDFKRRCVRVTYTSGREVYYYKGYAYAKEPRGSKVVWCVLGTTKVYTSLEVALYSHSKKAPRVNWEALVKRDSIVSSTIMSHAFLTRRPRS
jgi:hypothetical protein